MPVCAMSRGWETVEGGAKRKGMMSSEGARGERGRDHETKL